MNTDDLIERLLGELDPPLHRIEGELQVPAPGPWPAPLIDTPDGQRPRAGVLRTVCSAGHPLEGPGADVYVRPTGHRVCRVCRREHRRVGSDVMTTW